MDNEGFESFWNSCQLILSVSSQYPNKIDGKIEIEPRRSIDLIDHFQLYVNDVAQEIIRLSEHDHFSTDGFVVGERYDIYVVAHPKDHITDAEPISSNRRAFVFDRESQRDTSLISSAVPNAARIDDHPTEYRRFSAIKMIYQRSRNENDNDKYEKNKNLKDRCRPSSSPGGSIIEIKLRRNTIEHHRDTERSHQGNGKKPNGIDPHLPNDFKYQAQILLLRLTQAMENRSNQSTSTPLHPHTSYPGMPHYIYN